MSQAHQTLLDLLQQLPFKVYNHDVEEHPTYPYLLLTENLPRLDQRALTRAPHGRRRTWLVTPAGQTREAIHIMTNQVIATVEGARILGQRLELEPTGIGVEEEEGLRINGLPVFYTKLQFGLRLP